MLLQKIHKHPVSAFSHNPKISGLHILPSSFKDPWLKTAELENLYFVLLASKIFVELYFQKSVLQIHMLMWNILFQMTCSHVFRYSFSLFPYAVPLSASQQISLPVFRSPEICVEMYITGSPAVIQCRSGPQAGCGMCCLGLAQSSLQRKLQELTVGHCQQAFIWEVFAELPLHTTHCSRQGKKQTRSLLLWSL